jgi:hypothetical protein
MIGGFVVGTLLGAGVDLFTGLWGTGLAVGAVVGSLIGYWLVPPELRPRNGAGGSDGGGDMSGGTFFWGGGDSDGGGDGGGD